MEQNGKMPARGQGQEQGHDEDQPGEPSDVQEYEALTSTVRELIKVMRDGGINRLDVRRGDLRISLSAQQSERDEMVVRSAPPADHEFRQAPGVATEQVDGYVIASPMIGTFYSAPAPGERPFVAVGDPVEVGQTVAIIEAMKIMNEIVAERPGVVEEIFVADGVAVEYGHPLIRLSVTE